MVLTTFWLIFGPCPRETVHFSGCWPLGSVELLDFPAPSLMFQFSPLKQTPCPVTTSALVMPHVLIWEMRLNKGSTAFINHWGDCVTLCCNVVTEHTKVIVKKHYWTSDRRHYIFKSQCLNINKADNSDLLWTLTHPWSRESSSDVQIWSFVSLVPPLYGADSRYWIQKKTDL